MNEISRLFKKTKTVISSRGVSGFFDAGKSYLYKNFSFLSDGVQKTGDVLIVGKCDFDVGKLVNDGYICENIDIEEFNEKYINLYDIFCFGDKILSQVRDDNLRLIEKYNKLIVDKEILGNDSVSKYIRENKKRKIVYVSSSTNISGGVMVIAQHLQQLQRLGFNTSLISQDININMSWKKDFDMPVLHIGEVNYNVVGIDYMVATFWDTVSFVEKAKATKKYYLVQNKEYLFYEENNPFYERAKNTYKNNNLEFLTISRWCQKWLKEDFNKNSIYIPNCIDVRLFNEDVIPLKEKDNKKTRILIEGNPENDYKNVDEAFEIVNKLNHTEFEIWFISYGGKPKKWYKYDKLFQKIPYYEMSMIYKSCDILLKTSKLESFSYPPLEMMACGGMCVVAENDGNSEYVKNKYNALTYKAGDIDGALENIKELADNEELNNKLRNGGLESVSKRNLQVLREELTKLFVE